MVVSETRIQVILKAAVLVLIGTVLGLCHNALSSTGIPLLASERLTLADYVNWNLHLKGMRVDLAGAKPPRGRMGLSGDARRAGWWSVAGDRERRDATQRRCAA